MIGELSRSFDKKNSSEGVCIVFGFGKKFERKVKRIIAVLVLLMLSLIMRADVDTTVTVSVSSPAGSIKTGTFPEFTVEVSGLGTNEVKMEFPLLMKDGSPVGQLTGSFALETNATGAKTGIFTWGMTQVIDVTTGDVTSAKPGKYTLLLGVIKPPGQMQISKQGFGFFSSAETAEFEVVEAKIPTITWHHYRGTPEGELKVFCAGDPGRRYVLWWNSILPPEEWEKDWVFQEEFIMNPGGIHEYKFTRQGGTGPKGFFKLVGYDDSPALAPAKK